VLPARGGLARQGGHTRQLGGGMLQSSGSPFFQNQYRSWAGEAWLTVMYSWEGKLRQPGHNWLLPVSPVPKKVINYVDPIVSYTVLWFISLFYCLGPEYRVTATSTQKITR
jgi:hypothetical protein